VNIFHFSFSGDGLLSQGNPLLPNAVMYMELEIISIEVFISLPIYSIFMCLLHRMTLAPCTLRIETILFVEILFQVSRFAHLTNNGQLIMRPLWRYVHIH
jgi:hypothetical protein